jgi:hypothetical protein
VVVERVHDGGEGGAVLNSGGGWRGGRVDADVDIGGEGRDGEKECGESEAIHADEITSRAAV